MELLFSLRVVIWLATLVILAVIEVPVPAPSLAIVESWSSPKFTAESELDSTKLAKPLEVPAVLALAW